MYNHKRRDSINSSKFSKYIPILILIFELSYFGIPGFVKPIFVYAYALFFGLCYLFAILQDFFKISEKKSKIIRIAIAIAALVILTISIFYQAILSIIFATIMFFSFIFSLVLDKKVGINKLENGQKD